MHIYFLAAICYGPAYDCFTGLTDRLRTVTVPQTKCYVPDLNQLEGPKRFRNLLAHSTVWTYYFLLLQYHGNRDRGSPLAALGQTPGA